MDYRVQEILIKIEENISQSVVIRDLAKSSNISVSHLQHIFKKEVHTSIKKHVNNLRMQMMCELLEFSHLNISEILLKVGAPDATHFFRDFKQKFGKTPSEYRKFSRNSRNGY